MFVHFAIAAGLHNIEFPTPPNCFSYIPPRLGIYENYSIEFNSSKCMVCSSSDGGVVTLANWARANNFTLCASAFTYNWSPLTVTEANHFANNIILYETTKMFVNIKVVSSPYPYTKAIKVGTGISMFDLLSFLKRNGLGVYSSPSPGDISLEGVLAIGRHGNLVLAVGEKQAPRFSYNVELHILS